MTTPFPFVSGAVLTAAQMNAITTLPINDQTDDYTLVVGDVGKRVVMNKATENTVTVDDSIFGVGDTIFIANKGAGATTLTEGSGVTINSASGLELVTSQSGQLVALSASSFLFVASAAPAPLSGLVTVKAETAFSAVSNFFADGVFTSDYTNYRVLVRYEGSTGSGLLFQLRVGGVDAATNYNLQTFQASSTTLAGGRLTAQTSAQFAFRTSGAFVSYAALELTGPQLAAVTTYTSQNARNDSAYNTPHVAMFGGNHTTATAYDGIKILTDTGTLTGSYAIYGYGTTV